MKKIILVSMLLLSSVGLQADTRGRLNHLIEEIEQYKKEQEDRMAKLTQAVKTLEDEAIKNKANEGQMKAMIDQLKVDNEQLRKANDIIVKFSEILVKLQEVLDKQGCEADRFRGIVDKLERLNQQINILVDVAEAEVSNK